MGVNEQRVLNLINYCTARGFDAGSLLRGTGVRAQDLKKAEPTLDVLSWQDFNQILAAVFSRLPQPEFSVACQSIWTRPDLRYWIDLARLEPMPFRFFVELIGDVGLCFEDAPLTVKVIAHSKYQLRCRISSLDGERLAFPYIKMIESELEAFARETDQTQTKIQVSHRNHHVDLSLGTSSKPAHVLSMIAAKLSAPLTSHRLGLQIRSLHQAVRDLGRTLLVMKSAHRSEREQRRTQAHIAAALLDRSKAGLIHYQGETVSIQCPAEWTSLSKELTQWGAAGPYYLQPGLLSMNIDAHPFRAWLAHSIKGGSVHTLHPDDAQEPRLNPATGTAHRSHLGSQYAIDWLVDDETMGLFWPITQGERRHQSPLDIVRTLVDEHVFTGSACLFNESGQIQWSNASFKALFRVDETQAATSLKSILNPALIRRQLSEFYRDFEQRPMIDNLLVRLPLVGNSRPMASTPSASNPIDPSPTSVDLRMWARVVDFDNGLIGVAVFTDVSAESRLQNHILKLESQIAHLSSRASAGDISLGLAHDLGNLLTVARAQIETIRAEAPADATFELLEQSVDDSQSLTRELLAFGKVTPNSSDPINIDQSIRKSLPLLRHALPRRIQLHYSSTGDETKAWSRIPENTLRNVLLNLIINARDAIHGQGTIALSIRATKEDVEIDVRDSGHGIDPRDHLKIFEGFHTSKPEGHGLGLANIRDMIRRQGGDVALINSTTHGSQFRVSLPASSQVVRHGPSARILLIDPDETFASELKSVLEGLGAEVDHRTSAEQGAAYLARRHVYLDALMMELVLPMGGGHAVLEQAIELMPNQPIYLASASIDAPFGQLIPSRANLHLIQKPVNIESLATWILASAQASRLTDEPTIGGSWVN